MPAGSCPITCPCRFAADGAFLLVTCVSVAIDAPVFLGGDFATLVAAFLRAPQNAPLALVIWLAAVLLGLGLLGRGLYATLVENDAVEVRPWLTAAAIGAVILWQGWSLPQAWGAVWVLGGRAICRALIAGAAVTLLLRWHAAAWRAGYVACEARGGGPGRQGAITRRSLAQLIAERDRLIGEVGQISVHARELEGLLKLPGMRRAALVVLHPDPAKTDDERRRLTIEFQKASAIFDRLAPGEKSR